MEYGVWKSGHVEWWQLPEQAHKDLGCFYFPSSGMYGQGTVGVGAPCASRNRKRRQGARGNGMLFLLVPAWVDREIRYESARDSARQVVRSQIQLLQLRKGRQACRERAGQLIRVCKEELKVLELVELRGQSPGQFVFRHRESNQKREFDHVDWERPRELLELKSYS